MNKTQEKGVTLLALVIAIVILLIISSIGITAGNGTISMAKFTQFKEELKVLQTKVNELKQDNEFDIGQKELTDAQKDILELKTISDIIYKGKTNEEKVEIKNGFRYCDKNYIKNNFQFDNIKRDYLINVEYRYIICVEGLEYKGTTYYMINQIEGEIYNVNYIDKNTQNGSFELSCVKEDDRWKIEIINIQYDGYISNWKIQYRLEGEEWKNSNSPVIYVTNAGRYYVQVSHDDINLGSNSVSAEATETTNTSGTE